MPDDLHLALLSNRYQPGQRLGKGSCGIVHSAVDQANGQKVAIKRSESSLSNPALICTLADTC
jgi:serine/threonine protein kinase